MSYRLVFVKEGGIKGRSRFLDPTDISEWYVSMKSLFSDCICYVTNVKDPTVNLYYISPENRIDMRRVSGVFIPIDPAPETPIHESRVLPYRDLLTKVS